MTKVADEAKELLKEEKRKLAWLENRFEGLKHYESLLEERRRLK